MENKQIWTMGGLGLVLVALFALFIVPALPTSSNSIEEGVAYHSSVCPYVIRADGTREDLGCWHNTVTNGGKDMIKNAIALGGADKVSRLAVGNGSAPAAATTDLDKIWTDCGLGIAEATYGSNGGNGNWSYWKTWTSTCDGAIVNTTALYNATADVFAGTSFTATTLQTNDQITVNYTISIS